MPDIRRIPLLGRMLPDPDKAPTPDKPTELDEEESEAVIPGA